jgi:hypothetical protein
MRHDWIFDVLVDLRSYALKNGLSRLAAQVEVALCVAQAEVAAGAVISNGDDPDNGEPPDGRPD